jgi:hypothetical protein
MALTESKSWQQRCLNFSPILFFLTVNALMVRGQLSMGFEIIIVFSCIIIVMIVLMEIEDDVD